MRILRLLKRSVFRQQPRILSPLEGLPNEILRHITVFLPLSAEVAFALCCHRLYFVIGNSSWTNLTRTEDQLKREQECGVRGMPLRFSNYYYPPAQGEREELILLLEKDLPELLFCCDCALLHRADLHCDSRMRLCYRTKWTSWSLGSSLLFTNIQMVMKLFRLGLKYKRRLEEFSIHDISPSLLQPYYMDKYSRCRTREARIANGKFLMRNQKWYLFPKDLEEFPSKLSKDVRLCVHIDNYTNIMSESLQDRAPLQEMIDCQMSHWTQQYIDCPKCSGLRQCPFCETEYQIDARPLGDRGYAIVITSWWNLGSGFSQYDTEFITHFAKPPFRSDPEPEVHFAIGSIRGSFESNENFSIDSLLERYLSGRSLTLNHSRFYYRGKSK